MKSPYDDGEVVSITYDKVHSIEVKPTEEMLELMAFEREKALNALRDIILNEKYGEDG